MGSGGWARDPHACLLARDTQARHSSLPIRERMFKRVKVCLAFYKRVPASRVFLTVHQMVSNVHRDLGTSAQQLATPISPMPHGILRTPSVTT
jgi:hypothetical protein